MKLVHEVLLKVHETTEACLTELEVTKDKSKSPSARAHAIWDLRQAKISLEAVLVSLANEEKKR